MRKQLGSALGELGSLAGLLQAVLATFLCARITAQMAFHLEGLAVVRRKITEGPGRSLLDGVSLSGESTAPHIDEEVVLTLKTKGLEGSLDRREINGVVVEVVVARTAIDRHGAAARHNPDTGYSGLTTTGSPVNNAIGGAGH